MVKKLKITQTKSVIKRPKKQKLTIEALGLRRPNNSVVLNDTPQIRGMINRVIHLVKFEEIKEKPTKKVADDKIKEETKILKEDDKDRVGKVVEKDQIDKEDKEEKVVEGKIASKGTILIGVVDGDHHDIGKNIVKLMLEASGFKMIDLGKNIEADKFLQNCDAYNPSIVAMSTLMTTTMDSMAEISEKMRFSRLEFSIPSRELLTL